MDEKGLGQRLQEARKLAGMTQQTLCHAANISYSTLAKIERGAIKSPSIFTILNLTTALGITLDSLLGMEKPAAGTASTTPARRSKSKNGIQFVYFDVNGCLVHFFQRSFTRIATENGVSADKVESVFWRFNDAVCRGQMSLESLNTELAKSLGVSSISWQDYYLAAVESVQGMEELVRWTAEHYRVGLLTNIMPGQLDSLRASGKVPDLKYDVIIDSSQVGAIKPERAIFDIAAERAGCLPSEILLVDDDRSNIISADDAGWHVYLCDDYQPEETARRVRQTLELVD